MKPITLLLLLCCCSITGLANIIHVDCKATGANTGTSWQDAFVGLQEALAASENHDTLWVAQGTYLPTNTTERTISFTIDKDVCIFGGFTGVESALNQRDWEENETILSGNIGNSTYFDNSYNVVYIPSESEVELNGIIITGGHANGTIFSQLWDPVKNGGGIYVDAEEGEQSILRLKNSRITNNEAQWAGGGVFLNSMKGGSSVLEIDSSIIQNNIAIDGGGLAKRGGDYGDLYCQFEASTFNNNVSYGNGGAIYFSFDQGENALKIRDCEFLDNSCFLSGGGIYAENIVGVDTLIVTNCTYKNNTTTHGSGGGIYYQNHLDNAYLNINDSYFEENIADLVGSNGQGGGVALEMYSDTASISVDRCIFYKNEAPNGGGLFGLGVNLKLSNSTFVENKGTERGGALRLSRTTAINVSLINNLFFRNDAVKFGGAIYCSNTSTIGINNLNYINSVFLENSAGINGANTIVSGVNLNLYNTLSYVAECEEIYDYINEDDIDNISFTCTNFISTTDALFQDTTNLDFTPLPCSPLVNAGDNSFVQNLLTDFNGMPRIAEGLVDIGPIEREALSLIPDYVITSENCGQQNSVEFDIPEACTPYSYNWTDTNDNAGASNDSLSTGTYYFTITDFVNRQILDTIVIAAPPPVIFGIVTSNINCETSQGGSATVIPQSGTTPWQFNWSNATTDSLAINLTAGDYTVTATDALGCENSLALEISTIGTFDTGLAVSTISCHEGSDGQIVATPLGGQYPYDFNWSISQSDSLINNLSAGNYDLTTTDAFGCQSIVGVVLSEPDSLMFTPMPTAPSCVDFDNGVAAVQVTGGTEDYLYQWGEDLFLEALTNVGAGSYEVVVTDAQGCQDSTTVVVPEASLWEVEPITTMPLCDDSADGSIALIMDGGIAPYSFEWSNEQQDSLLTMLEAATYTVTITDASGCIQDYSVVLGSPVSLVANTQSEIAFCPESEDVTAWVSVEGGAYPYTYLWNEGNQVDSLVTDLSVGVWEVLITDANGCQEVTEVEVNHLPPMEVGTLLLQSATNSTAEDGALTVFMDGGTSPYGYQWSNGAATPQVLNLSSGVYYLTATDANGCVFMDSVFVDFETSISESSNTIDEVIVFPNPVRQGADLYVNIFSKNSDYIDLKIININGQVLFKQSYWIDESLPIRLSEQLEPGVYFISLFDSNGGVICKKVVVY